MRSIIGTLLASFILFSAQAFAEDFSADIIQKSSAGSLQGKMYLSGQKSRIEAAQATTIVRVDKNVMWILMPGQNMYMEQPLSLEVITANTSGEVPGEIERVPVGKEMIDGKNADKYKVTYLLQGAQSAMYQWYLPGLSIPVKAASLDNSWVTEYKNIKVGPQDSSLFEVPSGWKKFSYDMEGLESLGKNFGAGENTNWE